MQIEISPDNETLTITTPRGGTVVIREDLAGLAILFRLCRGAAERGGTLKNSPIPAVHRVLADYERLGPTGAGKVLAVENKTRHFTKSGREIPPLESLFD